jgi:hypothetical protein
MGVIPRDKMCGAGIENGKQQTFWQKIACALDAVAAQRSHRAVPAIALLRSKNDIARCRRLMLEPLRTAQIAAVIVRE